VRVVAVDGSGRRRALNHFNKKTKGLFARALLENAHDFGDIEEVAAWGAARGFALAPGAAAGEWDLVVPDAALAPAAVRL
jgi:hypothetical protein